MPARTRSSFRARLPWLALAGLLALPSTPRAALMLASPPYRPKDFTLVKKDGLFHIFYIRRNVTLPMAQSENDFGHAVSSNLYYWTQLPPVLPVRPGEWDNLHVWAPSIVERDGVYYMFYTGVSDSTGLWNSWQRTGLAVSTDLMTWNRLDDPVFSCVDVPWSWCNPANASTGFRDPFVMPDPAIPGRWLMYTSTFPATDTLGMIVGVAASTGDFTDWIDLKPLWITNQSWTYNPIVESPHLFFHDGLWYLFFTTNAGQPISYAVGPNPTGEPVEWTYKGRLGNMLGVDTQTWIASEYFQNGTHEYFMFANYNRIEIYEMAWNPDGTFALFEPGAFHVRALSWEPDSVSAGESTTFEIVATGWTWETAELEAVEVLPGGQQVPVSLDLLGLPASIEIQADTTRIPWSSRIRHASGDTTAAMTLIVRTVDHTAEAPPLAIAPAPFRVLGLGWSAASVIAGEPETLSIAARSWAGQSATLEGVEVLPGGGQAPVPLDSLALPSTVALDADTTRVPWIARIRHASGDSLSAMELVVRTTDLSASSPELTIVPPVFEPLAVSWNADSVGTGDPVTLSAVSSGWAGRSLALDAYEVLPWGTEVPVAPSSLGLPASLALDADTTRLVWFARIRHATGDTTSDMALLVRVRDYPLETGPLLIGPATFAVRGLAWRADSVAPGSPETLSVAARLWAGQSAELEGVELLPGGGEAPVPLEWLGLPSTLPLDADTTRVPWVARIRHASGDTTGSMALVVRARDFPVAADPLHLVPPPPPPGDNDAGDPAGNPEIRRWGFRMLARGPLGNHPSLLVTLPRVMPVRIDVFDLQGRRVRNLVDRRLPDGPTVVSWDGRDSGGAAVARGIYFARAVTPFGERAARLLVTR